MSGTPAPFGPPMVSMAHSHQLTGSHADTSDDQYETQPKPSAATSETAGKQESGESSSIDANQEQEVVELARRVSQISRRSSTFVTDDGTPNPFLDPERDPTLDPNSSEFNVRRWIKSILHVV